MDHKLELPPHIDASDFAFNGSAAQTRGRIPMRFEFKPVGLIKTIGLGEHKVELSWSSNDGQVLNRQSITLSRFKSKGQDCICLNCPRCGGRRKRLFLVPVQNQDGEADRATYSFACARCGGVDEERKRHTRQLNKKYARKAGWAWAR
jgi:hypothetical protein